MDETFPDKSKESPSDDKRQNEVIRQILGSDAFNQAATQESASDSLILGRDPDGKIWESIGPDGARLYQGGSENPNDDGGVLV